MHKVLIDLVSDEFTLGLVAVLEQSLEQAAAIVLVNEFCVFLLDVADGFIDELMLLFV